MESISNFSAQVKGIKEVFKKPVMLVGMMGAGKTYIGTQLAAALAVPFYDTDRLIEEKAVASIADIFAGEGEAAFRKLERDIIADLLQKANLCVISTGGGAILDVQTRALVKEKALSIWLDADLETLWARVRGDVGRPLLQADDPKAVLRDLLEARRPLYAQADITIKSEGDLSGQALESVINSLSAAINTGSF